MDANISVTLKESEWDIVIEALKTCPDAHLCGTAITRSRLQFQVDDKRPHWTKQQLDMIETVKRAAMEISRTTEYLLGVKSDK